MTAADPGAPPGLRIEQASKVFGRAPALRDVSLAVPPGTLLALVGESGAGKSTLLRCVNRLEDLDAGRVLIAERDVLQLDAVGLRRSIGYVPQEGGLLPHWKARRNAALVARLNGLDDADGRAGRTLELVGLDASVADRWPHELSGGQRQRVSLARALAGGQSLLLLDEPFGSLDAITRSDLHRTLRAIRAARPLTIVLVTHDLREAAALADSIAVLKDGLLEQLASPAGLLAAPATPYVRHLLERAEVLPS